MAMNAKDVIHQAADLLGDSAGTRWSTPELVRWLNAGQRQIIIHRADALNKATSLTCVAGTKQSLPADGEELIGVPRNDSAGSTRAVRPCDRDALDAQVPNWHSRAAADEIVHVMYDPREPKAFWVYPPATTNAKLLVNYVAKPVDVAESAAGTLWSDVAGTIGVDDKFANTLVDYILYRAWLKEGDTQDVGKASASAQTFAGALGIDVRTLIAVGPHATGKGAAA